MAPPALPGFLATMALSETQDGRDPDGRVGVASTTSGLPPITQIAFSTCRAHYPGGSIRFFGLVHDALPHLALSRIALAFPEQRAGRHPQPSFRGLLKLHSRYGLQICSPTLCGLRHEAPIPSVNPAKRPVSYPVIPTTPGVGLSPTGNLRRRGAPLFRKRPLRLLNPTPYLPRKPPPKRPKRLPQGLPTRPKLSSSRKLPFSFRM